MAMCFSFQDYPAEEILICYDSEFKYGQNFYMALTEEAKDKLLNVSDHDYIMHIVIMSL